jgi:vancomycin resistance protein VanW
MRRPLSTLNPLFYHIIVSLRRLHRRVKQRLDKRNYAKTLRAEPLKHRVYKHQSVLIRKLGDTDIMLQQNKVINLKLAVKKLNGIIIPPGETFSFWRLTGSASKRKGYVSAMLLSGGEAVSGVGGGLCQIANLIHWLILHSPLAVIERHHHSFDPFPDDGRVVPFGSGATLFYNYMDYQFTNNTDYTFQLLFWFDDKCIYGDLRADAELPYKYNVFEKNQRFVKKGNVFYRQNELWRRKYAEKGSSEEIETELLQKNDALVKYTPDEYITHL